MKVIFPPETYGHYVALYKSNDIQYHNAVELASMRQVVTKMLGYNAKHLIISESKETGRISKISILNTCSES
jgi:hypothetical protein